MTVDTDLATDWIALATGIATLVGIVWAAVTRATKPIRDRLDDIKEVGEALRQERERVDDLTTKVNTIEKRLEAIERRVEDLYHLLVSIIDPRRLRRDSDDEQP